MFEKLKTVVSSGIATDRLTELGLTQQQAKILAPVAVELNSLWKNTDQERRMLVPAAKNIISKGRGTLENIIYMVKQDEKIQETLKEVITPVIIELVTQATDKIYKSSSEEEGE